MRVSSNKLLQKYAQPTSHNAVTLLSAQNLSDSNFPEAAGSGRRHDRSPKGDSMRITTSVLEGVPKLLSSWPDIFGSYEAAGTIQHTIMQITPKAALGLDTNECKREEELSRLALAWAMLAHLESNFLKSEYQQNFAAKHTSKILGTLNREWRETYRLVLGDPESCTIIQDQHPHVLDFLEARLEVIQIAERLAVEPASP